MSTVFVCRLGPIPHPAGGINLYLSFANDARFEPIHANDDTEGLKRAAEQAKGLELTCAPELEAAGRALGFCAVPYSQMDAQNCANAAVGIALQNVLASETHPSVLMLFLEQAARFRKSPAARSWPEHELLSVQVDGATREYKIHEDFEAQIGRELGLQLMLFLEPGDAQRLLEFAATHAKDEIPELTLTGVLFESEPAFARIAVERAWGIDAIPRPYFAVDGEHLNIDERRLLDRAAVLWALSWLDPAQPEKAFEQSLEDALGSKLTVKVSSAGYLKRPRSK